MMIGMGLFWLAIILGFVWLVRDSFERRQAEPPSENALTTLDRRFAEGALSLEEYKQRRDVLTEAAAPHADQKRHTRVSERS
jgi:putative membrane protein